VELDTLIIADAVSTPPDGKFYVHGGGFSRYEVPALPFPLPLGVLIRLRLEDADFGQSFQLGVTLIGPTGNPNVPGVEIGLSPPPDSEPALVGEERSANIALQIPATAQREGVHRLEITLGGVVVATRSLPVQLIGPPLDIAIGQERPSNGNS
jgi:hypothetical protein